MNILILDDLMEQVVKDPKIMSVFNESSHHKNISVLFLMQNMYKKRCSYANNEHEHATHGSV